MSDMRAATAGELTLLRTNTGQWSKLYIAGLTTPPTVFAARVNKSWTSYDKIISVPWESETIGAYTDIVPGMTLWVGTSAGGRELGEVRVRSATATDIFIGETSDIKWVNHAHLTVKDEFLLWPRHVLINSAGTVYMDSNIPYSDQHEVFDPVPVMGSDVVVDLLDIPTTQLVTNGTFTTVTTGWTAGTDVLLTIVSNALHINRNSAAEIDHAYQNITTQTGMVYTFSVNIKAYSHGYEAYVNNVKLFDTANGTGVKSVTFTATGTTTEIAFRAVDNATATLDIDDVSVVSASVIVTFPEVADSWVFGGGAITKHFESNAGTWTNHTANNAALTIASYPTNGLIRVWLTVTKSGKSTIGYRYIYVYDETHRPESVFTVGNLSVDYDSGGWSFDVTAYGDLSAVRDRAKVILFAKDYYGDTQISLGQAHERENIVAIGYINSESTEYNAEMSQITFNVQGPQYWLNNMSGFPPGVEILGVASWTRILNLTVDKAVWHLLHWRSTATNVIDVRLSGDTRLASAFEVPAESIWAQMVEIAQTSIFANPGCNRLGQLSLEIEPQLVPATPSDPDERTWATVMELTKADWQDKISMLCGCDKAEISMLAASGVSVNTSGVGTPYFSLSPGHVFKHYGNIEVNDRLLLSSQSQSNTLTGLIVGWKNNYYPSFDMTLAQNNRLLDVFPRSFCNIVIAAGDTVRGKAYSGNLILRSMSLEFNADTGAFTANTNWEAETFPELSTNGDPPIGEDCGQTSCPAGQHLNSLHCCEDDGGGGGCNQTAAECAAMGTGWYLDTDKCCKYSGGPPVTPGAKVVAVLSALYGMAYTVNFDAVNPNDVVWIWYNEGLTEVEYQAAEDLFLTPDGHVYIICRAAGGEYIAVAPALGEPFVKIIDSVWINDNYPVCREGGVGARGGLVAFGINYNAGNEYAFIAGEYRLIDTVENFDIYYNSLDPVSMSTSLTTGFPACDMVYAQGHWYSALSSYSYNNSKVQIVEDAGSVKVTTTQATTGTHSWLWAFGDENNKVVKAYALSLPLKFTGDGTDYAEWTFDLYDGGGTQQNRFARFACDPTGTVLMAVGVTNPVGANLLGLYLSSDSGATWTKNLPIAAQEGFPYSLCIANGFDANMWVVGREMEHIFWTFDQGVTWVNRAGNLFYGFSAYKFPVSLIRQIRIGYNAPA
jgi:hypothetical protein